MIPQGVSKFAPSLSKAVGFTIGMEVKVITEPKEKIWKDGKKSFLFCDVSYEGSAYGLSISKTSYYSIAAGEGYGEDPVDWMGKKIKYAGMKDIKTPMGTVKGHIWSPMPQEIDVEAPF
jgi:hypothetical protein